MFIPKHTVLHSVLTGRSTPCLIYKTQTTRSFVMC